MNDINELFEIISSLGGAASIKEIASAYAKKYKMPVSLVSQSSISSTLSKDDRVQFDAATFRWMLIKENAPTQSETVHQEGSSIGENSTPNPQKASAYDRYQSKRQRTEALLKTLCAGSNRIKVDTSKVKSTPVSINLNRVMSIYYRSDAVRIDVVMSSGLYAIARDLESDGIAYQRPGANPYATPGTYAIFVNEENEEIAYSRLLGLGK